jgi:glutamate mutase epsilon subunit
MYLLPAWSISILLNCKVVVFNTAKVSSQSNIFGNDISSHEPIQQQHMAPDSRILQEVLASNFQFQNYGPIIEEPATP